MTVLCDVGLELSYVSAQHELLKNNYISHVSRMAFSISARELGGGRKTKIEKKKWKLERVNGVALLKDGGMQKHSTDFNFRHLYLP